MKRDKTNIESGDNKTAQKRNRARALRKLHKIFSIASGKNAKEVIKKLKENLDSDILKRQISSIKNESLPNSKDISLNSLNVRIEKNTSSIGMLSKLSDQKVMEV